MVGVLLGVVLAFRGNDAEATGDGPEASTTTTQPVSDVGKELLARLENGRMFDLHVLFEPSAAEQDATGQKLSVEVWRSGEQVRQDIVLEAPGVTSEIRAYQLAEGNFLCQREGEADWRCEPARSVATEEGAPTGLIESAAANLQGAKVEYEDTEIFGMPARCYEIAGDSGDSTLCVGDDGAPLALAVQGQRLEAVTLERSVAPSAFDLPAAV